MSSYSPEHRHFRVGILGGMGPEAGVLLQTFIIRATPASTDQEHIEALTYTNPKIPDRTESLDRDGGASYAAAVKESLKLLENAGVDIIVMACNTAHARFDEIQASVSTPLLNIVELARNEMEAAEGTVGILATDGTIARGLFAMTDRGKTFVPQPDDQRQVMRVIRDIKAGADAGNILAGLTSIVAAMSEAGCVRFLLGCTELSIYREPLVEHFGDIFIDPLVLAARKVVEMACSPQTL